jgi:hypothetical protein
LSFPFGISHLHPSVRQTGGEFVFIDSIVASRSRGEDGLRRQTIGLVIFNREVRFSTTTHFDAPPKNANAFV